MENKTQRFIIKQQLSSRKTANAFLAYDEKSFTDIRLRRIHSPLTPAELEKCQDALHVLRRQYSLIKSDHIINILDAGIDDQGLWIAVPYHQNLQLLQALTPPISLTEFHRLARQLLSALKIIHDNFLVHGALNPNSVDVIIAPDQNYNYAIRDFGMRKLLTLAENPATLARLPSEPAILAPELFKGEEATPSSDLYMLGQLLYYLLAGGHPLVGLSAEEALEKHLQHDIPLINSINKTVPQDLAQWLDKLIQPEPQDRPFTADEALQSLPAYNPLAQLTPSSGADSTSKTPTKESKTTKNKSRTRLIAASAILAAILIGSGIYWKLTHSATDPKSSTKLSRSFTIPASGFVTVSGEKLASTNKRLSIGSRNTKPRNITPWGTGASKSAQGPDLGSSWRAVISFKVASILDAKPDDVYDTISSLHDLKLRIKIKRDPKQSNNPPADYLPLIQFSGIYPTGSRPNFKKAALLNGDPVAAHNTGSEYDFHLRHVDLSSADYLSFFTFTLLGNRTAKRNEFINFDPQSIQLEIIYPQQTPKK